MSVCRVPSSLRIFTSPPAGWGAQYCDKRGGLIICLFHLCMYISETTCPDLIKFYAHVTYGRGSVFLCGVAMRYVYIQLKLNCPAAVSFTG